MLLIAFKQFHSFIEFPNSEGGPLDVRYSMTMLCWVYYKINGQDGPLFNYRRSGAWGVHLWVTHSQLFVRFAKRDYSLPPPPPPVPLLHTALADGWKFLGATYDRSTGDAKLWMKGFVVKTLNIEAGLELATQDSIKMGAKIDYGGFPKGRIAQMQVYNKVLTQEQIQVIQQQT